MQNRDGAIIKGKLIPHNFLQAGYVCGVCGGPLVTRFKGAWITECARHPDHDDQEFVPWKKYRALELRRQGQEAKAKEVFDHLPEELKATIRERNV